MSDSTGFSSFQCPKCLTDIPYRREQAGSRIQCPACNTSLVLPENVSGDSLFDDLFNDNENLPAQPDSQPEEDHPNTIHDESELDTGLIDSMIGVQVSDILGSSQVIDEIKFEADNSASGELQEASDPFTYDEDKPLQIDDIIVSSDPNKFYVRCTVCDSKLEATDDQVGKLITCADCFSEVRIEKPKKRKTKEVWRLSEEQEEKPADHEFNLSPPVERPKQLDSVLDPGLGLDNIDKDLLKPLPVAEEEKLISSNQKVKPTPSMRVRKPNPKANSGARAFSEERAATKRTAQPFSWKQVLELKLVQDLDLMIRSVVATSFLALAYAMVDSVWRTTNKVDLDWGGKVTEAIPAAFGAFLCFATAMWFLCISFSVLMASVANGDKKVREWVGFAPSEWLGSFLVVLVSAWAAMLPGVLLSFFLQKLTGFFFLVPLLTTISGFALLPLFLISSFHNESVTNIFNPVIIQTLSSQTDAWIVAYKVFGIALGVVLFGLIVLWIPSIVFCFVGAAIQVAGITVFSILIGLLAKSLIATLD